MSNSPHIDRSGRHSFAPKSLAQLIEEAKAKMDAMTPEERRAMFEVQKASWVRGEMAMNETSFMVKPKPSVAEGPYSYRYCQSGAWPDRFWWYEIYDSDGNQLAQSPHEICAMAIVNALNKVGPIP